MNPALDALQAYPFEKLRALFAGATPDPAYPPISLGIGEPRHPTPELIKHTIAANLGALDSYPPTAGSAALREAIAAWIGRRYGISAPDPASQVLPINGSREALFAFAQTVIDRTASEGGAPVVVCPNPFYQIYEGAAILAGAEPVYVNMLPDNGFRVDYASLPEAIWRRTQLLYTCSPGNPTGKVMSLDEWREVFALADRYGFVIASDECYSEIYFDEAKPPIGALEAAAKLGRDWTRLVVFSSLSKRSNVPGMRSGFVAGDAAILKRFLLYRTYHGSAMSPLHQLASIAAWNDESHVRDNRRRYVEKFRAALPLLGAPLATALPDGGFYFWIRTPIADDTFARRLYAERGVTVLPGSYLARASGGVNPGRDFIRIALVAPTDECLTAVRRLADFAQSL